MKRFLAPAALVFVLAACAHVDYVGRSYAPTSKVDLFFDERDVRVDYEVMGQLIATANDFVSAEKLQSKIMKKAGEKGADAVVISGMDRYKSGSNTSYEEETKDTKKGSKTTGQSSTSDTNEKEIRAVFLKYKN
jgi:hypothetical protein